MKAIAILQARMCSSRIPGKSLIQVGGKPSLEHIQDSLTQVLPKDSIFIATFQQPENDVLRSFCDGYGVRVLSGDEDNVASQYVQILAENPNCDYFFRVCGATPLYDYRIIMRGLEILKTRSLEVEIVTSRVNKGYPRGMNIERSRPVYLWITIRNFRNCGILNM